MNDGVGESFPAFVLVGPGLISPNGKGGIEEEDSLFDPTIKIAGGVVGVAQIGFDLFIDILQRGGWFDAIRNGKGKSVCLTRTMIRILTKYDDLYLIHGQTVESVKDEFGRRIDGAGLVFLADKFGQIFEI